MILPDEPRNVNPQWSDDSFRLKMLRLHGGQSSAQGYFPPASQVLFRPAEQEVYILDAVYAYYLFGTETLTTGESFVLDNGIALPNTWASFVGAWDAAVDYEIGEGVSHLGLFYVRRVQGTSATAPAADAVNWFAAPVLTTATLSTDAIVNRAIRRIAVTQNNEVITHDKPLRLRRLVTPVAADASLGNLDLHFIIRLLRLRP